MARKKVIASEPKQTSTAPPQNHTNSDARPRRTARERLESSVLKELWSIWRADPRVPSIKSRRSWAISRDASPRLVGCWFLRRKTCAKRAGQPMPVGTYDLPVDHPIAPKREPSATSVETELEGPSVHDLRSDDTLAYPPEDDASSDTAFDEDVLIELRRAGTPAYKEAPRQCYSQHHHFQLESSVSAADLYVTEDHRNDNTPFEDSLLVCNQGRGKQSNFTCVLCSTESIQGAPDEVPSDFGAVSSGDLSVECPRLDFHPNAPWELSAIPFLFRTPSVVVAPGDAVNHQTVNNWANIEDELARLVNEGKLDFSFLDVPHLASMKLHD